MKKSICVIGLGYIGLPTAAVLANKGFQVTGVDVNKEVIKNLKKGRVHIIENGLENLVKKVIKNKNLKVQSEIPCADVFIIAVSHKEFLKINPERFVNKDSVVFDVKGMFPEKSYLRL